MFKVIKNGTNRLDIEMSGKLNAESMKVALDELVNKSEGIKNGKILYVIIDFQLPTLSAIGIEFSRLPSMFGLMKKFNRAAVLTDKTWLKNVSEFEGALFPGLEIKAFNLDQKDEAETWLSSQVRVTLTHINKARQLTTARETIEIPS
ncbi:MAG: STAS/SEC14 domain-containing protein [Candidatus Scalindua sp.]